MKKSVRAGSCRLGGRVSFSPAESLESRTLFAGGDVTTSLTPIADAYVRGGAYAAKNMGKEVNLLVKKDAPGHARETHVQFAIGSAVGDVSRAVLRLYGAYATKGATMRVAAFAASPTPVWSETALTWNNSPPAIGGALSTVTVGAYGWYEWDVTDAVRAQQAAGGTTAQLVLKALGSGATQVQFASKDASGLRPALVLTSSVTLPPPTGSPPVSPPPASPPQIPPPPPVSPPVVSPPTVPPVATEPPAAPATPTVSASYTRVELQWPAVSAATSYNLYRVASTTLDVEPGATPHRSDLTTTSFAETVDPETSYVYFVSAVNGVGEGGISGGALVTSGPTQLPPAAPMNLTAAVDGPKVTLQWDAVTNADSYDVFRVLNDGTDPIAPAQPYQSGLTATSVVDITSPLTAYRYFIRGVNEAGAGELTAALDVNSGQLPPPAAPQSVTAVASGLTIQIAWQSVDGATGYNLYRRTDADAVPTLLRAGLTTPTATDTDLPPDTTFHYTVAAVNVTGEGAMSAEASATTGPATPPLVKPALTPTATPGLSVNITGGTVKLPDGSVVSFAPSTLKFDAPEIRSDSFLGVTPPNYTNSMGGLTQSWFSALPLVPASAAPFRGGLFRGVIPSSVVVQNSAGSKTYVRDVDYKLNAEWGQVANTSARLGTPGNGKVKVSYKYVMQRLDLVQVLPNGTVSVKRGQSAIVCPELPQADPGALALAGIFVYTLDAPGARTSGFTITAKDILPIDPLPPAAPINASAIPKTLAKLAAGKDVTIAWHGDSITSGAEVYYTATDRSRTYTGRVVTGLKARYPNARITEHHASMGGISAEFNGGYFQTKVLDAFDAGKNIDLVVIALGMNDPGRPINNFSDPMRDMIRKAKARGIEVLLVTTMPLSTAVANRYTSSKPAIAEATRELGRTEGVAVADVHQEWMNLPSQGIPSFVPVHNWSTHPGEYGMKIYADTILRLFDTAAQ